MPRDAGGSERGQEDPDSTPAFVSTVLLYELLELRNRAGATLPRIANQPTLLDFGRRWREAGRSSTEDDVAAAYELLRACINDLYWRERDLLLAQYAFTFTQASRERREAAYLEQMQRSNGPGSPSSFDRWSRDGAKQVAQRIIARVDAAGPAVAPASTTVEALEDEFAVRAQIDRYRFRDGRVLRDMVSERHVTSQLDGSQNYLLSHFLFADPTEEALEIVPEFGCAKVDEFFEDGRHYCLLRLARTLNAGEEFWFSYRAVSHTDIDMASRVVKELHQDEARWVLDIEFTSEAVPVDLSRFDGLSHVRGRLREYRRRAVRPHDGSRYIHEVWRGGLKKGLTYGVDWDWEPRP